LHAHRLYGARGGAVLMRTRLLLLVSLAGCSAASDFDYSFRPTTARDAAQDAAQDAALAPDAQTVVDAEAGVPPGEDASTPDAGSPDAGCATCCELIETSEHSCDSRLDEDCDGRTDCADSDCRQAPNCCPAPTIESGDTACTDELDNDCDGLIDCQEASCKGVYECTCGPITPEDSSFPASCADGNDNDCDRLTDCEEKVGCAFSPACCTVTASTESGATCSDGLNNDCDADGLDCADPDCRMSNDAGAVTSEAAACGDNVDNDCDGEVDCEDSDCRAALACCKVSELVEASCNDGKNNDCDSQGADCYDDDCALDANCCRPVLGGESTGTLCTNRKDDDCDGQVDCDDTQCAGVRACCIAYLRANGETLQTTETSCVDRFDNDCDGALNCKDGDCNDTKACGIIIKPPVETQ
jgi:hypothetical protein